jgi:lipoate-protein ligase A
MTAAGRKIVGSAQVRRNRTILQHGSVPITLNIADHLAVMPGNGTAGEAQTLSRAAVGVSDLLGRQVTYQQLAEALVAGFGDALELELQTGQLTDAEEDRAGQLRAEKYTTDEWNLVRPQRT